MLECVPVMRVKTSAVKAQRKCCTAPVKEQDVGSQSCRCCSLHCTKVLLTLIYRGLMSRERLPLIGSSRKKTAKPPLSSPALQRPHHANHCQRSQRQDSSSFRPGRPSILLSDTTMTPWGGLALSDSSFTSISPPHSPPQPPPSTPHLRRQKRDAEVLSLSFNSPVPSPPAEVPLDSSVSAGGVGRELRERVLPQCRVPRLPPIHPITNLSFSRSFTFSFFELPLHQSPRCRAERTRNLMMLLKQIHY